MKKISLFILLFMVWGCWPGAWNAYAQDKIVAVVNNEIITQKDLNDFINVLRIQLSEELEGRELESKVQSMKLDLINKLIEDRLILQEAKREKLQPNENMVKARIEEIKKNYPSEEAFNSTLDKQGLVQADLEDKIREQMLMRSIVEKKVKSKVVVSPNEVTEFYQRNMEKMKVPEQRRVEVMNMKSQSLAGEIYSGLKNGKTIKEMFQEYSLSADEITVMQDGQLRKDIEDRVFELNLGETTEPIEVEGSYYVFRLSAINPPRQQSFLEAQEAIRSFLLNEKMQKELVSWIDELKKNSYITIRQS
jgi:parvulin-like peptidyl-prolyl isomerase